jgi:hypothetical protein
MRAGASEVIGWTLNVSRGGVRVIVEEPVELGREYQIVVGDGSVRPRPGRVVWVQDEADGQIAGVQFLDSDGTPPPRDEPKSSPSAGT